MKIKAIIFDLDMCILDTHSLTGDFFQPVLDALYGSRLTDDLKKKIHDQLWTSSVDDTIKIFDIPLDIGESMREAYRHVDVPDGIYTYGDEAVIRGLAVKKFLVTSGYQKFQSSKIAKLGIADLFDEVIEIDQAPVESWTDMSEKVGQSEGKKMAVVVLRGGEILTVFVVPEYD